jgi:hypothetical protein
MYSQPNIYSKNEYQNKIHFIDQNSIVSINRDNMPCNKIFLTQK